jgi:hypothetical protein
VPPDAATQNKHNTGHNIALDLFVLFFVSYQGTNRPSHQECHICCSPGILNQFHDTGFSSCCVVSEQ